ncbi:MAG TPA: M36 family metallopeptidase [Pyrinomonadaceae bacterium]|nr:M36 family metallopeptidase [Pyrinomonadaceae bacterium]
MIRRVFSFKKTSLFFAFLFVFSAFIFWNNSPSVISAKQTATSSFPDNYDIRTDKNAIARKAVDDFVARSSKSDSEIQTERKNMKRAEDKLRQNVSDLKVEYNEDLRIPEVISPEIRLKTQFLTSPSSEKRDEILKDFIRENSGLFGIDEMQLAKLKKTADYTNPNGVLSFVQFEQEIKGIPVFRGEVKAGFTKKNEIIRVINNLAPNVAEESVSNNFGIAENAVRNAAKYLGFPEENLQRKDSAKDELKITFERGNFEDETTAEKMYFPIDSGVVRPSWRVLLWTKNAAFYVIVDSESGTVLWHKNITENQTQPATYNVYGNQTSLMKTADSPSPFSPGCLIPTDCRQPSLVPRTDFTLIGNEPPYTFNNNGWIPDGENRTIGNNAEAGIDRMNPNGIDDNGWAFGDPNRVFSYAYNPAPGNPPPGEEPVPTTQTYPPSPFQQGAITHAFYAVNRWHDELYRFGFNEQSRNFQTDNFGRGGLGEDSISVEIQEGTGTSGANFSTPADGGRGRLQMFIWTGSTPDRDGALDSQILIHEVTHGLSNRLHSNGNGLTTNMSRGMGEGWSDFYALALMSEPTDDRLGTYTTGGYVTYQITAGFESNYYYGIRRFPTAVLASVGANNRPHNPFTFRYLNSDCNVLIGTGTSNPNSAFPRGPIGVTTCDQVNNIGEIWSVILWEMRDKLIGRHGAAEGNRRALQYVTDAMKFSPIGPTMLQSRDAIIAAALASDSTDATFIWQGFALRGMGYSASIQNAGTGANNTVVTESFDLPGLTVLEPITITELQGDGDGQTEMGETVSVTLKLTNTSGITATDVTASIVNGMSQNYGTISNGQIVTRDITYFIPRYGTCDPFHVITINISSNLGTITKTKSFRVIPSQPGSVFTNNTLINVPNGQPSNTVGAAAAYPSVITVSGIIGTRIPKVELTNVSHTWFGDIDVMLESPSGQKFTLVSDIYSTNNATNTVSGTFTFTDDATLIPSSSTVPVPGEYKPTNYAPADSFPTPAPAAPYQNPAPTGSATFASVFNNGSNTFNGDWKLWIVDDTVGDSGTIQGWKLSFESPLCIDIFPTAQPPSFDGDLMTDVSVFRPSDGNWYMNRSSGGFTAINWGIAADKPIPGDYDGDQKTDTAVFRNGNWLILNSSNNTFSNINWGLSSDILVQGDYDGDYRTDPAVFRDGAWFIRNSANGNVRVINFGQSGDRPVPADFDGDFKTDAAVFRNGIWYIQQSFHGFKAVSFGLSTDKLVAADYDNDGRDDIAVYRPENGTWYRINSTDEQFSAVQFGQAGDIPVPGDYDGDFKTDQAVYRNGIWYLNRSRNGFQSVAFGAPNDIPIPSFYVH